ncbi:MAG: TetR/AcrR family transcriptional regulator [Hellea sp.]
MQVKSNKARSNEMRAKLITTARDLFTSRGYSDTSTPEIVKKAGVTRGALYHHFPDKKALFRAVIKAEAEKVANQIESHSQIEGSARDAISRGSKAYFEAISGSGSAALLLLEGPAVLGLSEMAEIDSLTSGQELKQGLEHAVSQGELANDMPIQEMSDILSAAFDRAALSSISNPAKKDVYEAAISKLIGALFQS